MRQASLSDPEAPEQLLVATVTVVAASIVSALAASLLASNRRQAIRAVQVLIAVDVLGYIALLIGDVAMPTSKLIGSILGTGTQVWLLTHLLYLNRMGSLAGPALRPLGLAFWSHKYSRDQLLVISRWLLVIVACVHEGAGLSSHASAATDEGAQDAVGMMFIGFIYLVAAVLPSMWVRIAALAIWVLDLGYTNLAMEGTSPNGLAFVYMIATAVLVFQMIRFRNAQEPGAAHVLLPGG